MAGEQGQHRGQRVDTRVEAVPGWFFWPVTALGLAVMGFGIYGMWVHQGSGLLDVRLRPMLTWMIGAIILHDVVLAPLTLATGRGLRGIRPRVLRAPLQVGLAATLLVTLLAFPLVRGYGARPGDPSRLPLDYAVGYGALLGVIWLACAAWAWRRGRRGGDGGQPDDAVATAGTVDDPKD
jgi:hypothetical protein